MATRHGHDQWQRGLRRGAVMALCLALFSGIGQAIALAADPPTAQTPQDFSALGKAVGRTNATQIIDLAVPLKVTDAAALTTFLDALYDPASPTYKHYLTPADFTARFLSKTDRAAVVDFLKGQNLTVTDPGIGTVLTATGTTAAVERAFNVTLTDYQEATGRVFRAPDKTPALPQSVAAKVEGLLGLDTSIVAHRASSGATVSAGDPSGANAAEPKTVTACAAATNVKTQSAGSLTTPDITKAYDFAPFATTGQHEGEGVTIALAEIGAYKSSNVATYQTCFGTNIPVSYIPVGSNAPVADVGDTESELDIDVLIGTAPKLRQINAYASSGTLQAGADTFQRIANDNTARIVSASLNVCELQAQVNVNTASGVQAYMNAENSVFQQMASQGQTMLASSGDFGATPCKKADGTLYPNYTADDPAGQPYVTGVGGTKLVLDGSGNIASEVTWNDSGATGGGYSTQFARPAYQNNVAIGTGGKRQVPDVAADASPFSGYVIFAHDPNTNTPPNPPNGCPGFTGNANTLDCWESIGGTSAATPLWAAWAALTDQYVVNRGQGHLGFLNPALYRLYGGTNRASLFHDITSGNNCDLASFCGSGGTATYQARVGYDLTTGMGSFDAGNLAIAFGPAPVLNVPSTFNFGTVSANQGTNKDVIVTNSGNGTMIVTAPSVSGAGFTLNHNGCAGVYLSLGETCPITITFTPTSSTQFNGSVYVSTNGGSQSVTLTGGGAAPTASLSTGTLDFGGHAVGSSNFLSVTLTNTGTSALSGISASFTSPNTPGSLTPGDGCSNQTLQPSGNCIYAIQFQPAQAISYSGTITISSNASNGTQTVTVRGVGSTGLAASPTGLNLGTVAINTTGGQQPVTFTNNSGGTLSGFSVSMSTAGVGGRGGFVKGTDNCTGASVPNGSSCTVYVALNPQTASGAGNFDGRVTVTAGSASAYAELSGTGLNGNAPVVSLSSVTFGNTPLDPNHTYASASPYPNYKAITLTNTGNSTMQLTGSGSMVCVVDPSNGNSCGNSDANFRISSYGTCDGASLAPGASCLFKMVFAPTGNTTGGKSGTVKIQTSTGYTSFTFSGTAVSTATPVALANVTGPFNDFGAGYEFVRTSQTLYVFNNGNTPLSISSVAVASSSLNATDFSIGSECNGQTVYPNQPGCGFTVSFTPQGTGLRTATIQVTDNATDSPQITYVQGTGYASARATFGVQSLTFGGTNEGAASAEQAVFITNTGDATLNVSFNATGDFTAVGPYCYSISAGQSCGIGVTFRPTDIGTRTGTLTFTDNSLSTSNNATQEVVLTGTGVAAGKVSLPGSGLTFNPQVQGTRSDPQSFRLENTGHGTLSVTSVVATGDYTVLAPCAGGSVGAGSGCIITVVFAPTAQGTRNGTLTITDNAGNVAGTTQTLTLNGSAALSRPQIADLSVKSGPLAGGGAVSLLGSGFVPGAVVRFGTATATITGTPTDTNLTVTVPMHAEATVDVTVTNPDGQAATFHSYTYLPANFVPTPGTHFVAPTAVGMPPKPAVSTHAAAPTATGPAGPNNQPVRH